MNWRSSLIVPIALVSFVAGASDFGLGDQSLADQFRAEARAIAEGPKAPERAAVLLSADQQALITSDEDLTNAYRSDPKATMDLVKRILERSNPGQ